MKINHVISVSHVCVCGCRKVMWPIIIQATIRKMMTFEYEFDLQDAGRTVIYVIHS